MDFIINIDSNFDFNFISLCKIINFSETVPIFKKFAFQNFSSLDEEIYLEHLLPSSISCQVAHKLMHNRESERLLT